MQSTRIILQDLVGQWFLSFCLFFCLYPTSGFFLNMEEAEEMKEYTLKINKRDCIF